MSYSVVRHVLHSVGSPVKSHATPNVGGTLRPLYLIIHYTAGTTDSGAVDWFANRDAKASAHLVIAPDGTITQMVPFNRIAWHAGVSRWNGLEHMNQYAIGIELVNAGKLRKNEAGSWVNWAGVSIPHDEVTIMTHKNESSAAGWQIFPGPQLETLVEVGLALNRTYKFLDILGHDDVSPRRKVDPGPAFPMTSIESRIMGRA